VEQSVVQPSREDKSKVRAETDGAGPVLRAIAGRQRVRKKNGVSEFSLQQQERSRLNFEALKRCISCFERRKELWKQLELADCDIWMGCNDNVVGFDVKLHPLGSSDPNLHIFTREVNNGFICAPAFDGSTSEATLTQVSFSSLLTILVMGPVNLQAHDLFVAFGFKDPFSYTQPGYLHDKFMQDGKVCLDEVLPAIPFLPGSSEQEQARPADSPRLTSQSEAPAKAVPPIVPRLHLSLPAHDAMEQEEARLAEAHGQAQGQQPRHRIGIVTGNRTVADM